MMTTLTRQGVPLAVVGAALVGFAIPMAGGAGMGALIASQPVASVAILFGLSMGLGAYVLLKRPWASSPIPQKGEEQDWEQAARMGESRRQAVLQAVPDAIFQLDQTGKYLDFIPADGFELMMDKPLFLGKKVDEVMPPDIAIRTQATLEKTLASGKVESFEYALEIGGEEKYYEARLAPCEGEVTAIVRDITPRRRMEDELKRSEAEHKMLFDFANDAIFIVEVPTTKILKTNPRGLALVGYSLEDIQHMTISDLDLPEDREKIERVVKTILTEGAAIFEHRLVRADGSIIPVEISSRKIEYQGRPALLSFIRDISDRIAAREALGESEALLREAQRLANIGHWDWDLRQDQLFWSDEMYRIYGLEPALDVNILAVIDDLVHPDDLPATKAQIQAAIEHCKALDMDSRIVHPDGTVRYVQIHGRVDCDAEGKAYRLFGTTQDVTERREAEHAQRRSEARFRALIEQSPFSTVLYNLEGQPTYENSAFYTTWNLPEAVAHEIRKTYNILQDNQLVESGLMPYVQKGFDGEFCEMPVINYRPEDADPSVNVWIKGYIYPILDDKGGVQEVVLMHQNVTAQKEAEAVLLATQEATLERQKLETERVENELEKARGELVKKARLAAIGQVAASIAHELRNPLGAVRNASFYLRNQRVAGAELNMEYLQIIEREVASADRIISNLMEMSRAKVPLIQPTDLIEVMQNEFERIKGRGQTTLSWSTDAAAFIAMVDPIQMRQVFNNMFANAIQAMDSVGQIEVTLRHGEAFDIITIRDDGPGIDPAYQEQVFEPLFTTRARGTGLGLPICRQIIERHGGTLRLLHEDRPGATLQINLPRQPHPARAEVAP